MVMIDMREIRLRKQVRERMTCSICHGIAADRMICGHESEAMKKFIAQEETITRELLHVKKLSRRCRDGRLLGYCGL